MIMMLESRRTQNLVPEFVRTPEACHSNPARQTPIRGNVVLSHAPSTHPTQALATKSYSFMIIYLVLAQALTGLDFL